MEYHPEWETPSPEALILAHSYKMQELLNQADFDMMGLNVSVKSYMNANELIWGWKEPTTDRDHIDLISAVLERHPMYRFKVNHPVEQLLHTLRNEPVKAEVVLDDYYPTQRRDEPEKKHKVKKTDIDHDWTNGNGVDDGDADSRPSYHQETTVHHVHTPSHSHHHHDSGSHDSGTCSFSD